MASCCNPLLCQANTTTSSFSFSIPHSTRHHPFPCQSQSSPLNLHNQVLSTTSRSKSIKTSVPRSSYDTPPTTASDSSAKKLRGLLESSGIQQGPTCFDALSAKLIEFAGFRICFISGFSVSSAQLGLPDVDLMSSQEMVEHGSLITQAVSIPVIGDGDNGHGNAMNVKSTVKGFIKAGFAGIILNDQAAPEACEHTEGRKVVSREEAVMKIKAAIDARKESGSDIVIVARTDSRQAVSFEESLWRSRAFADAGADVLFIDALALREEMKAFCEISPLVPKMANMLGGGGQTPIFTPVELEELGFKLVSYPLSLISVSVRAMEDALAEIRDGRIPPPRTGYSSPTYGARNNRGGSESVIDLLHAVVHDNKKSSIDHMFWNWSHTLRVKVTRKDGHEKLDTGIPVGFLGAMSKIIQGFCVNTNIMEMLEDLPDEMHGDLHSGKILLDFHDAAGDRIQVLLE